VTSGAPPPAATLPLPGELISPTEQPPAAPFPGAQPGLPLDPLAPPIAPQPSGDGGGFPAGLGSIPPGAITAPGETKKDSTAAPVNAPDAPAKAPESVAPPGTVPAPAEKAAVPAPPPAPEGSPPPASTAPPEGSAGGTSPPPSR
jgi:hypothetical protein